MQERSAGHFRGRSLEDCESGWPSSQAPEGGLLPFGMSSFHSHIACMALIGGELQPGSRGLTGEDPKWSGRGNRSSCRACEGPSPREVASYKTVRLSEEFLRASLLAARSTDRGTGQSKRPAQEDGPLLRVMQGGALHPDQLSGLLQTGPPHPSPAYPDPLYCPLPAVLGHTARFSSPAILEAQPQGCPSGRHPHCLSL